jgi:hypothetical protein
MERNNYWPNKLFKWAINFFYNNCFGELLVNVCMQTTCTYVACQKTCKGIFFGMCFPVACASVFFGIKLEGFSTNLLIFLLLHLGIEFFNI